MLFQVGRTFSGASVNLFGQAAQRESCSSGLLHLKTNTSASTSSSAFLCFLSDSVSFLCYPQILKPTNTAWGAREVKGSVLEVTKRCFQDFNSIISCHQINVRVEAQSCPSSGATCCTFNSNTVIFLYYTAFYPYGWWHTFSPVYAFAWSMPRCDTDRNHKNDIMQHTCCVLNSLQYTTRNKMVK